MSTKRGVPTGTGTNAWTGTHADVDETINNVDTGTSITADTKGETITLTLPDGEIAATDYVWQIDARAYGRTNGSGNDSIGISINGNAGSLVNPGATYDCHTSVPPQNRDLGTSFNWNAVDIILTADQSGMPTAVGHEVASVEYLIQYFKSSPNVGEVAFIAERNPGAISSDTATFSGSHTAKSGNILLLMIGINNGSGVSLNAPSGYTFIGNEVANAKQWHFYYKISDGTETSSGTISTSGGTGFNNGHIYLVEIEWGNGVDSVQFSEDTTDVNNTSASTATTPSVSATNQSSNVTFHAFGLGEIADLKSGNNINSDAWDYYGVPPSISNGGTGFCWAVKQNATGSQSVTFTDNLDAGSQLYAVSIVFNEAASANQNITFNQVTETDTPQTISPSTTVTVGFTQVTETDVAQTFAVIKADNIAYNQVIETDTAQAITALPGAVTVGFNQVVETDTAQLFTAIPGATTVGFNQVIETDTPQSIAAIPGTTTVGFNQVIETDTAQLIDPVPGTATVGFNQVTETDTANSFTPSFFVAYNQVTETDTPQPIAAVPGTATVSFNAVVETDVAQTFTITTAATVGFNQVTETDTAQTITPVLAQNIGFLQVVETDTPQPLVAIPGTTTVAFNQVVETDTAQIITPLPGTTTIGFNQVTETDTAQVIASVLGGAIVGFNQVVETDTAQIVTPLAGATTIGFNQITETDTAQIISPLVGQIQTYNQVTETDTAQVIVPLAGETTVGFNQVVETDTAQPFTTVLAVSYGQVVETDTPQVFNAVPGTTNIPFAQVTETDLAQIINPVGGATVVSFNQVTETDTAQIIDPIPGTAVVGYAQVTETDVAQVIGSVPGEVTVGFGQVTETNTPQGFTLAGDIGGVINAVGYFPTGSTVTIELYDPPTGQTIALDDNTCEEIGITGVFVWDTSKLTTQPTGYQEYAWRMTDGTNFVADSIVILQDALVNYDSLSEYIVNKTIYG